MTQQVEAAVLVLGEGVVGHAGEAPDVERQHLALKDLLLDGEQVLQNLLFCLNTRKVRKRTATTSSLPVSSRRADFL